MCGCGTLACVYGRQSGYYSRANGQLRRRFKKWSDMEAISDIESDGDVVLLGLAPRFREDLCFCPCLLIHHTFQGPGSDTPQRPPRPAGWPLDLCTALSCVFAHRFWHSLTFFLFFPLRAVLRRPGQNGQALFFSADVFSYMLDIWCLSFSFLLLSCLPGSLTAAGVSFSCQ